MEEIPIPLLLPILVAITGIILGEYYSYKRLQNEKKTKILEWLHSLNINHYTFLVQYTYRLSEWLGRLELSRNDETLLYCLYLFARYLQYSKKLVDSTGGIYLLRTIKSSDLLSKLSQEIRMEIDHYVGGRLEELVVLGKLESPEEFKAKMDEESSLKNYLLKSVEEYRKQGVKKLSKFLIVYSRLLNYEIYSLYQPHYGKEVRSQFGTRGELYNLAHYILGMEQQKKQLLENKNVIKRNVSVLEKHVDDLRNKGYKDNQSCEIFSPVEILPFRMCFLKNFVIFTRDYKFLNRKITLPWPIGMKKTAPGPLAGFKYTIKYKYVKEALTKSQTLESNLDKELKEIYDKEIKYGSTKIKSVLCLIGILGFFITIYYFGWLEILLDFTIDYYNYIISIGIIALSIVILTKGIKYPKTIKTK